MNKMFDYLQAQAEENALASNSSGSDRANFNQAPAEVHALTQGTPTSSSLPAMTTSTPITPPARKKRPSTYAIEERTLQFGSKVRAFAKRLPKSIASTDDVQQLLRAAAAVGASYIEANEAPTKREFVAQIRICLKEAKESTFWLRLTDTGASDSLSAFKHELVIESRDLMRIFFAILRKIRVKQA
jgi:four helix bundle protein